MRKQPTTDSRQLTADLQTPCDLCKIRIGCDWLSAMCRLRADQVFRLRPDLVYRPRQIERRQWWIKEKQKRRIAAERLAADLAPIDAVISEYIRTGKNGDQIDRLMRRFRGKECTI